MKENEKRVSILVEEGDQSKTSSLLDDKKSNKERLKKPLIFGLMGIVFVGCMYLIFKPSSDKKEIQNIGLNDAVPQATEAGMQADKQKAYEQEMLEQKDQEKRNALATLSDYWNTDDKDASADEQPEEDDSFANGGGKGYTRSGNSTLNSYRNAQSTLGSFYQDDNAETAELRRQLDELKEKLAEKNVPAGVTVDDQLALMENHTRWLQNIFRREQTMDNLPLQIVLPAVLRPIRRKNILWHSVLQGKKQYQLYTGSLQIMSF